MTLSSTIVMFGAMMTLAVIPDSSAMTVVARSIGSGLSHGIITIIGILVGDLVFIIFAVYGLEAIAGSSLFTLVKYFGAAYLIWLGIALWRSKSKAIEAEEIEEATWWPNFLCGLLITLSDPKAIFFYISFLPAFLDFSKVSIMDTGIIMILAVITAGGAKLGYAFMAVKARTFFINTQAKSRINVTAGSVMICTGAYLAMKI
jgi:threonine/homoserine/homoserine lactone efflux protein